MSTPSLDPDEIARDALLNHIALQQHMIRPLYTALRTAIAERDALAAQVRALREALQTLYDDWQGSDTEALNQARAALGATETQL